MDQSSLIRLYLRSYRVVLNRSIKPHLPLLHRFGLPSQHLCPLGNLSGLFSLSILDFGHVCFDLLLLLPLELLFSFVLLLHLPLSLDVLGTFELIRLVSDLVPVLLLFHFINHRGLLLSEFFLPPYLFYNLHFALVFGSLLFKV